MVLTRSQRTSRSSSKSDTASDSGNPKANKDVEMTKPKTKKPNPSTDENLLPDSTSTGISHTVDKDAVAMAMNDECLEKEQSKRKRSRKRNRKRKSAGEDDGQTEACNVISSTSSNNEGSKHRRTMTSEDEKQDASLVSSRAISTAAPVVDETQKENVLATDGAKVETEEPEDAPQAVNLKEVLQLYKQESYAEGQAAKPKGKPKSGRPWKTEQTTRFSGMKQDRPLKTSWQKKMQRKAEMKNMKMFESELKEAKNTELERKKKYRAKKIKRKLENQRKSEVVQVISNPAKIKRMKKKQLRKIEMRSLPDSSKKQVFNS